MYLPTAFRDDRPEVAHDVIRRHPLGLLVSAGSGGLLADPLPFLVYPEEGEFGTLRAHLARANPHWQVLSSVDECMVAFMAEQAYVSPAWYAAKREHGKVVPTWNYAAVHAWGKPRVIEDAAWLRRLLNDLTHSQESHRLEPWHVDDAPADYLEVMVGAIVGVEIPIRRLEGKFKASQNRPAADRAGVVEGLRADGAAAMAALVEARGQGKL
ncbi:transcriptional regulator [Pandoraea terrae]|uniref:Transcriptional regulator n=1 Tax=Pandoraea terrae TaxID=1537710 RepID=A0A5E4X781_9BURK|nr:FMN-binding negative transcriptional regulator [Pandoraea terrae]VVE32088.1 transcriptional regulator [Pandoraea terrae]